MAAATMRILCYTWGFLDFFVSDGYTTRGVFAAVTDVLEVTARYEHETIRFSPGGAVTRAGNRPETESSICYEGLS